MSAGMSSRLEFLVLQEELQIAGFFYFEIDVYL